MRMSLAIGALVGLLTGGWMWAEYALGLHTTHDDIGRFTGALAIVFPLAGIVFALRRVRDRRGSLRLGEAMRHGALLSLAAAVVMFAMSWVYAAWLNPGWITRSPGATAAGFALQSGLSAFIGGLLLAAIVGWILGRRAALKSPAPG
jgi:chromate transport protein ChrA